MAKLPISEACADAVGLMPYLELDRYLICRTRRDDTHQQVKLYRVDKQTGDRTDIHLEDENIFRFTEWAGAGRTFYVLKQDLLCLARVDADTLEETVLPCVGSFPRHLCLTPEYLYYATRTDHTLIIRLDPVTGQSAGMDAEAEDMNMKEDAWLAYGNAFYGMHEDYDRELLSFYKIDMDICQQEVLWQMPFSLERYADKPELLKEAYTFTEGDMIYTLVEQSRHTGLFLERVDLKSPAPVQRISLAGPFVYAFWQAGVFYLASMKAPMAINSFDPATGVRRELMADSHCFALDEHGHIYGDRPQVVGRWLYYMDHEEGQLRRIGL